MVILSVMSLKNTLYYSNFDIDSSLTQQTTVRHVAPLGYFIPPASLWYYWYRVVRIWFDSTGSEHTIYHSRCEHVDHYINEAAWSDTKM